jgi:ABC-2 type transport system ATP-binding protein
VLFLDEPTAGLDPQARRGFHDLVHHLVDSDETTVLLTTHDLDEAEKLADLEVRHASLEDTYMSIVAHREAGDDAEVIDFSGGSR